MKNKSSMKSTSDLQSSKPLKEARQEVNRTSMLQKESQNELKP